MITIHDLRRAAEAMAHSLNCQLIEYQKPLREGTPNPVCTCKRKELLATLDAAEKHLREMVLQPLEHAWDSDSLLVVERLAAFLNADDKGTDDAT